MTAHSFPTPVTPHVIAPVPTTLYPKTSLLLINPLQDTDDYTHQLSTQVLVEVEDKITTMSLAALINYTSDDRATSPQNFVPILLDEEAIVDCSQMRIPSAAFSMPVQEVNHLKGSVF
ncbi:hypothetical protein DSO57_1031113 [Entomophthora muscae]|uniref:Uncharacterized protein n=1 Tax=Entomophthora muscae TaxID=34485 RepID=A0ACC2RRX4_9FUNG|nr:hypothetical protein DSO57_1031113 [Entomophthora muscae]